MSADYMVKCSRQRCGHVHAESLRVEVPHKVFPDSTTTTCPLCGCDSVYYLKHGPRGMVHARLGERDQWLRAPAESDVSP